MIKPFHWDGQLESINNIYFLGPVLNIYNLVSEMVAFQGWE